MVAEVTGRPLDEASDWEITRWCLAWEDEPPLAIQTRDLLALLVANVNQGLGGKLTPKELIPKRKMANELPTSPAIEFFKKYGAEIETDGIQH